MKEMKEKINLLFKEVYKNVEHEEVGNEVLLLKKEIINLMDSDNEKALAKCDEIKENMVELSKKNLRLYFDKKLTLIFAYFGLWESDLQFQYEILPFLELNEEEKCQYTDLSTSILLTLKKLRKKVKKINNPNMLKEFNKLNKNFKVLLSDDISYRVRTNRANAISKQIELDFWNDYKMIQFLRLALIQHMLRYYYNQYISFWS